MTARRITDLAASVRQRLYNNAKATGRPFQEVLQKLTQWAGFLRKSRLSARLASFPR